MPTINSYRGDAIPIAKVVNITPVSVVAGQRFTVWCNTKPISYVAGTNDTAVEVAAGLATALQSAAIAEFQEFVASAVGGVLVLTAANPGVPFDVTVTSSGNVVVAETTVGQGPTNEVHKIALTGVYTAGNFTITYNFGAGNVTTANIAWNATAATVQAAIVALAGVGAGQCVVTGGPGPSSPWFVTWTGTLAGTAVAVGTINGSGLTGTGSVVVVETQHGNGLSNTIQTVNAYKLSTGTYTLTLAGQTTAAIAYNATPATVQTAIQSLPNVGAGNVSVYGLGGGTGSAQNLDYYWVIFNGTLAGTSVAQMTANLGLVRIDTLQTGGAATANDFQMIDLGGATGGTFTITFQGVTSPPLNFTAGAGAIWAAVRNAIDTDAGWSIGSGNVTVFDVWDHVAGVNNENGLFNVTNFLVEFTGSQANTQFPLVSIDGTSLTGGSGATVTRIAYGHASLNEIQTVTVNGSGGTFTLTLGAQTTNNIAWNAAAATVQTRIQTDLAATITACTVTGAGTPASPYSVTVTTPANTGIALMTGNAGGLSGGGLITELVHGTAGTNEVQSVTAAAGVSGGTFTLAFNGPVTQPIAWNATAAQVQAALRALSTINTVTVTGAGGGPFTVTWSGSQGSAAQALLVADGTQLTGASTSLVTLATATWSSGPSHYDDGTNWSLGHVPNTLEAVVFDLGSSNCSYGLNQIAVVTANAATDTVTWSLLSGGSAGNGSTAGSFVAGQMVYFTNAGGGLPAPLATGTLYYLVNVNRDAGTAQLSATLGGAPIDITTAGTGTHTMGARLASIEETERFGGAIGLARLSGSGYQEYRPRYLHVGLATTGQGGAQAVTIGTDTGSGAGKTQIDNDVDQAAWFIVQTGGSIDSEGRDIMLKGTHTSNTLEMLSGDAAVALFEGETANLASIKLRGGTLELGPGVTVAGPVTRTGGTLICDGCALNGVVTL